ncbi:Methionine aminopeptidase 1D chloroplastic/mitochondrial [Zea mays]|uniref:Methionine aminopeptidase 1D chloroplastic/mitochondrial n=1 Tax=Zea mays TaxID=4577 RepID=A0A1D6GWL7_MAIZE|nr:Methionine aminopeptidase 1D chloroplastic/mitochondrial [Zea mays]
MVRALRLGGHATSAARWFTCRRTAVALCMANLVAALLVARTLYAPDSFAFAPKRGELKYSREQMRWVEESIRIRGAAEPVELIEAKVKKLRKAFTREEKTRKGLPLELNQKVSLEILQRLHDLGEGSNTTEQVCMSVPGDNI